MAVNDFGKDRLVPRLLQCIDAIISLLTPRAMVVWPLLRPFLPFLLVVSSGPSSETVDAERSVPYCISSKSPPVLPCSFRVLA